MNFVGGCLRLYLAGALDARLGFWQVSENTTGRPCCWFERRASTWQPMLKWFRTSPRALAALSYVAVVMVLLGAIRVMDPDLAGDQFGFSLTVLFGAWIIHSLIAAVVRPALRKDWLNTCNMAGAEIIIFAVIGLVVWSSYVVNKSRAGFHESSSGPNLILAALVVLFLAGVWLCDRSDADDKCWLCAISRWFRGRQYRCFACKALHPTFDELLQRASKKRWGPEQLLQRAPGLGWKVEELALRMMSEGSWDYQAGQPITEALDEVLRRMGLPEIAVEVPEVETPSARKGLAKSKNPKQAAKELPANQAARMAALQKLMSDEAYSMHLEARAMKAAGEVIAPDGRPTPRADALAARFAAWVEQSREIVARIWEDGREPGIFELTKAENQRILATARVVLEAKGETPDNTAQGPSCPECGSARGIYCFSDEEVPKAGDYGPCVKCFNGLIYEVAGAGLKLRKWTSTDLLLTTGAFSAEDLAAPLLASLGTHAVNPAAKTIFNFLLVSGTPEENQKELLVRAILEASRLVKGDDLVSFASFLNDLPFEARSSPLKLLLSKAPDEDKRKLLLSLVKRHKTS
jgi:hypothetical protein